MESVGGIFGTEPHQGGHTQQSGGGAHQCKWQALEMGRSSHLTRHNTGQSQLLVTLSTDLFITWFWREFLQGWENDPMNLRDLLAWKQPDSPCLY